MTIAATRANLQHMRKAIQTDLFTDQRDFAPNRYQHGGDLNLGKRKLHRPFKRNAPTHVTFKSSIAQGRLSMRSPKNKLAVEKIIEEQIRKNGGKLHSFQNVGNHVHLLVSFKTKEAMARFFRAARGLIARHVMGSKKGKPASQPFWEHIPFTRITRGFKDFQNVVRYIMKNTAEAEIGAYFRAGLERTDAAFAKAKKTGRCVTEFL